MPRPPLLLPAGFALALLLAAAPPARAEEGAPNEPPPPPEKRLPGGAAGETPGARWKVPVLVLSYFPLTEDKKRIDRRVTNKESVMSDIEDWRPEGFGERKPLNCEKWGGDQLRWFIYWMQAVPGEGNGLSYRGKPLANWWGLIGDYDRARREKIGLVDGKGTADAAPEPDGGPDAAPPRPPPPAPTPERIARLAQAAREGREAIEREDYVAAIKALFPLENAAPDEPEGKEVDDLLAKIREKAVPLYVSAKRMREAGQLEEAMKGFDEVARCFEGLPAAGKAARLRDEIAQEIGR